MKQQKKSVRPSFFRKSSGCINGGSFTRLWGQIKCRPRKNCYKAQTHAHLFETNDTLKDDETVIRWDKEKEHRSSSLELINCAMEMVSEHRNHLVPFDSNDLSPSNWYFANGSTMEVLHFMLMLYNEPSSSYWYLI